MSAALSAVDHVAQQVGAREVGMRRAGLGRIVRPAVMALGEDGDRVDMRLLERRHEVVGIERRADAGDMLGGVEVEVDLAVAQRLVGRVGMIYSLAPGAGLRPERRIGVGRRGR